VCSWTLANAATSLTVSGAASGALIASAPSTSAFRAEGAPEVADLEVAGRSPT
jgi:hypothetical protein